jgi:hypothetical protein
MPAFVPGRTAVFDRLTLGLISDIGHLVFDRRFARAVVAVHRAGFVVDDIRAPVVAGQEAFLLVFPEPTVLNDRTNLRLRQRRMDFAVVGRFVIRQRLDPARGNAAWACETNAGIVAPSGAWAGVVL